MGHDYALDFNGRHPLSTAFNDILAAICYLEVPVTVYCGHIAGGEPVVLQRGILLMLQSVMKVFEAAYITGYTSPAMGFFLEVPMVKQLSSSKASLQLCTESPMCLSPGLREVKRCTHLTHAVILKCAKRSIVATLPLIKQCPPA